MREGGRGGGGEGDMENSFMTHQGDREYYSVVQAKIALTGLFLRNKDGALSRGPLQGKRLWLSQFPTVWLSVYVKPVEADPSCSARATGEAAVSVPPCNLIAVPSLPCGLNSGREGVALPHEMVCDSWWVSASLILPSCLIPLSRFQSTSLSSTRETQKRALRAYFYPLVLCCCCFYHSLSGVTKAAHRRDSSSE